jgi:hypothetical protein
MVLSSVCWHSDMYASRKNPASAICVQNFNDSQSFAIRITYHISLRSSSMRDPRHPLLKVVLHFDIGMEPTISLTTWLCLSFWLVFEKSCCSDEQLLNPVLHKPLRTKLSCFWLDWFGLDCMDGWQKIKTPEVLVLLLSTIPFQKIPNPNQTNQIIREAAAATMPVKYYGYSYNCNFSGTTRSWISGVVMILPQVHLRKPCYDFTFL